MRIRPRSSIFSGPRLATLTVALVLGPLGGVMGGGCGGSSAPRVDPRPLSDGGLPERVTLEAGRADVGDDGDSDAAAPASDALHADAPARDATDGGGDDLGEDDVSPLDAAATSLDAASDISDAASTPTILSVQVVDPVDNALLAAAGRFTPLVMVQVTTDPGQHDDVKEVDVELWSTGTMPAKISSTTLSQLSKTVGPSATSDVSDGSAGSAGAGSGSGGAGGGPAGDLGDAGLATAPPGSAGSAETLFTFGDTPVDLSSLSTDSYELRVLATTLGGVTALGTRRVRVDAGPVIRIIAPTVEQAARGAIFVSVEVTDPYSSSPPDVTFKVANIPVAPLTRVGDLFQVTVAETISLPSMPPLSGEQLLDVGAVNAAGVAARHAVVPFVFDDVGPIISNGRPATGVLVGGIIKIEADITDSAGVDTNTVVAVVAHGDSSLEVKLDQDPADHKHFSHLFDTRSLSNTVLYPTISFRASDLPGNQSNIGYTVAVDNTPPLADLDPPADLRLRHNFTDVWRCSWQFDPLGTDAVNDGDLLLQLFDVRARVQDEGNAPVAGGADITPLAGLDPAHVELLALDDTNRALVVDTDGDGICDAVNPRLVPTTTPMSSQDALLVNLAPVPPIGTADFTPDPSILDAGFSDCTWGTDTAKPSPLCRTSDLTVAIPYHQTPQAGVWSIPPVVPSTVLCVGNQLDALGNHLGDGPACLAVHAVDQLGNSQVSRVLHVCIDHDGNGAECPFAPIASVQGGAPVRIDSALPHGLTTGDRVLVGAIPTLFDANGLWKATVTSPTSFTLDSSSTPSIAVAARGQFMRWTSTSDCTGRQTAISPLVVDDATPCRPWRRFTRGEHLEMP